MRIVTNPKHDPSFAAICTPAATENARKALSLWPGYSPTPLLSLAPHARKLGMGEIWLKHEGSRFGVGSFKALGAANALACLLKSGFAFGSSHQGTKRPTLSCSSDGNYGRAVAWAAQQLGCDCVVCLPRQVSDFREDAIRQYGARILRVQGNYDAAEAAIKRATVQNGWVLFSDSSGDNHTAIPRDVMVGYCVMLSEIADSMPLASFTHVFLQCGVGAFAAAVCDYLRALLGPKTPTLISVEPLCAACVFSSMKRGRAVTVHGSLATIMAGLACGRPSPIAWEVLSKRLTFCTTLHDVWSKQAVRLLARGQASGEPVVAGETGAAGLGALLCAASCESSRRQLGLDSSSRVLLFCTEGATDPAIYSRIIREKEVRHRSGSSSCATDETAYAAPVSTAVG